MLVLVSQVLAKKDVSLDVFWKWLKTHLLELRSGGHSTICVTQRRVLNKRDSWLCVKLLKQQNKAKQCFVILRETAGGWEDPADWTRVWTGSHGVSSAQVLHPAVSPETLQHLQFYRRINIKQLFIQKNHPQNSFRRSCIFVAWCRPLLVEIK